VATPALFAQLCSLILFWFVKSAQSVRFFSSRPSEQITRYHGAFWPGSCLVASCVSPDRFFLLRSDPTHTHSNQWESIRAATKPHDDDLSTGISYLIGARTIDCHRQLGPNVLAATFNRSNGAEYLFVSRVGRKVCVIFFSCPPTSVLSARRPDGFIGRLHQTRMHTVRPLTAQRNPLSSRPVVGEVRALSWERP
jgi:hypothetical protein